MIRSDFTKTGRHICVRNTARKLILFKTILILPLKYSTNICSKIRAKIYSKKILHTNLEFRTIYILEASALQQKQMSENVF